MRALLRGQAARQPPSCVPNVQVQAHRVAPAAAVVGSQAAQPANVIATERPSIVVMPFTNIGDGARLDMLARGFTEDVTTGLARYPQLFVIGRESAVAIGEGALDERAMGRAGPSACGSWRKEACAGARGKSTST